MHLWHSAGCAAGPIASYGKPLKPRRGDGSVHDKIGILVDNVNILSILVDIYNYIRMSTFSNTSGSEVRLPAQAPVDLLHELTSLFTSIRQAIQLRLNVEGPIAGLGPRHYRLLLVCQQAPGITQQGLVQRIGRDKGQIARVVHELVAAGLLRREPHPEDRRSHLLQITSAGAMASAFFSDAEAQIAAELFGWVDPSRLAALVGELHTLRTAIAASGHAVSGSAERTTDD